MLSHQQLVTFFQTSFQESGQSIELKSLDTAMNHAAKIWIENFGKERTHVSKAEYVASYYSYLLPFLKTSHSLQGLTKEDLLRVLEQIVRIEADQIPDNDQIIPQAHFSAASMMLFDDPEGYFRPLADRLRDKPLAKILQEEKEREMEFAKVKERDERQFEARMFLRTRGFGPSHFNDTYDEDRYFDMSIQFADTLWSLANRKSFANTISKADFINTIYPFLEDQGYLGDREYLEDLTKDHLGKLFDIYSWTAKAEQKTEHAIAYEMDFYQFWHAITAIFRENIFQAKEITLAQTVDAIYNQEKFLKNKLKCLSNYELNCFSLKTPGDFIVSLEEGRQLITPAEGGEKRKWLNTGFNLVLNVRNQSGKVCRFPLIYSYPETPVKMRVGELKEGDGSLKLDLSIGETQVAFTDLQGNAHKDLAHLERLAAEFTVKGEHSSLPALPKLSIGCCLFSKTREQPSDTTILSTNKFQG